MAGAPAWALQFVPRYHANSLVLGSTKDERLTAAARRNRITVAMGHSERDGGSLYMRQRIIRADGRTIGARRELKPTHVERTIFGEGDGSDLAVHDTDLGRLGALCCWEHLQPLTKYAMDAQGEQVHVASWPSFSLYRGVAFALGAELNGAANRMYAAEGQCDVLASSAVATAQMRELLCDTPEKEQLLLEGMRSRSAAGGPPPVRTIETSTFGSMTTRRGRRTYARSRAARSLRYARCSSSASCIASSSERLLRARMGPTISSKVRGARPRLRASAMTSPRARPVSSARSWTSARSSSSSSTVTLLTCPPSPFNDRVCRRFWRRFLVLTELLLPLGTRLALLSGAASVGCCLQCTGDFERGAGTFTGRGSEL